MGLRSMFDNMVTPPMLRWKLRLIDDILDKDDGYSRKNLIKMTTVELNHLYEELDERADQVQSMIDSFAPQDWQQYELKIANEFKTHGVDVKMTKSGADGGLDIVGEWKGTTIGIQVKDWKDNVGNKVVGEVLMGMGVYKCDYGCVVARNGYTERCKSAAKSNRVALLSKNMIGDYVKQVKLGII